MIIIITTKVIGLGEWRRGFNNILILIIIKMNNTASQLKKKKMCIQLCIIWEKQHIKLTKNIINYRYQNNTYTNKNSILFSI